MEGRSRRWILVVDDDATVRSLLIDVLEREGYAAVGAEDGYIAEELIRDIFPDLILLDLRMPRGSGWSLMSNVREHQRWQHIPVLIVSGHIEEDQPASEPGLNIVGWIEKPVEVDTLVAKVREVLQA
ncbi:MAG: response regulator [Candidatus Rokuibacteriota bacterium]